MSIGKSGPFKARQRPFGIVFLDESVTFVTVSVALCILAGALSMMLLTSCAGGPDDKKKVTQSLAVESLRMIAGYPESLRIIAVSDVDSVFGNNFFSEDELMGILNNLYAFNSEIMDSRSGIDFDDPGLTSRMQRGMRLSDIVQQMLTQSPEASDELTGWKVRIMYETVGLDKDTVRSERYFIFDKDQNHILNSFEIPLL